MPRGLGSNWPNQEKVFSIFFDSSMRSALISFLFWKMFPFQIRKREKFLRSAGQPIFLVIRPSFFFLFLFGFLRFELGLIALFRLCVCLLNGGIANYIVNRVERKRDSVFYLSLSPSTSSPRRGRDPSTFSFFFDILFS